jgi:hypothetical protein
MRKKSGQRSTPDNPAYVPIRILLNAEKWVATLQRYRVSFDSLVVESLCQEFGCTARTAPTGHEPLLNFRAANLGLGIRKRSLGFGPRSKRMANGYFGRGGVGR